MNNIVGRLYLTKTGIIKNDIGIRSFEEDTINENEERLIELCENINSYNRHESYFMHKKNTVIYLEATHKNNNSL